jgi:hypothetical protein
MAPSTVFSNSASYRKNYLVSRACRVPMPVRPRSSVIGKSAQIAVYGAVNLGADVVLLKVYLAKQPFGVLFLHSLFFSFD